MKRILIWISVFVSAFTGVANAQQTGEEVVWVQIEAHPSLNVARERAQIYEDRLADVNGFSLGGNWYGILLGPYTRADAQQVLRIYRAERRIPADSFIAFTRNLGQQYWPEGADLLNRGAIAAPVQTETTRTDTTDPEPAPEIKPSDETPAEARRSEAALSREERQELQIALRAAGFYNAAIDGAFGRGTRASMGDWQTARGYESTGVLTTLQRKALIDEYNAPLISVGMGPVSDPKAGIEIQMPLKAVKFSRYEPPFVHYDEIDDSGIRVLLISQPGEQATLFGLYDIMQTLEIVPLEGPRERKSNRFTLEGRGNGIVSYTQASLKDGQIKGFTLIWPEGDDDRRARVLEEMKKSFSGIDGVLDPAAGGDTEQSIDLVSGLEVRKPRLSRSGFFVDTSGTVVTTVQAVDSCARVTLDTEYEAELVTNDAALGVAVLRPVDPLAPMSVAQFRADEPRLQSDVAVAGYPFDGVLGAPTLTFGTLADIRGLKGEAELSRLALVAQPGDAGGPVLDAGGSVLGMLLPREGGAQKLPEDVSFAADAAAIRAVLEAAGLNAQDSTDVPVQDASDLNRLANGMTVLVSCWN